MTDYVDLLNAAEEQKQNILMVYRQFEDKKPVMLFDIQEQRIYAYPFDEFKQEFGKIGQASLTDQYQEALTENQIVVFVRDNEAKRLASFSLPCE